MFFFFFLNKGYPKCGVLLKNQGPTIDFLWGEIPWFSHAVLETL